MTESTKTRTGISCVAGIAIGRAVVWRDEPARRSVAGTVLDERARLERGIFVAKRGVLELIRLLPRAEAELFEPELMMLDELGATLGERLRDGVRAEDVVDDSTSDVVVDLLLDARARILDAIAHDQRSVDAHLDGRDGDVVLIAETLTPSVVASLPARVVGIVAASDDPQASSGLSTSHAAILARGRDIPLAFLPARELAEIVDDATVVVNTLEGAASVSVVSRPEEQEEAQAQRREWMDARAHEEAAVSDPLVHLGVDVFANVGSLHERVPASADGIGLVRTELVFSDHVREPSEAEQFGALCAIAAHAPRSHVVVRLFDAGGDKPIGWLATPEGNESARGIALLLLHPRVLDRQLRALVRAADHFDVRVLVPFVRAAADVTDVRARLSGRLPVGALVETPEAVERIDEIASAADFVSIGTNDLSAIVAGSDRASARSSLDPRVLRLVEQVVVASRARSRPVTVCGELAGDPLGVRVLAGLGVQAVSVAPARVAPVKLSLRNASREDCLAIAREAMRTS